MKTAVALAIAVCGTVVPVRWSEARDQALNYDAPGSCPTRAQLLAALARQTAKEHGGRSNDVTGRIVVEIGRADAGWHGSLRLIDGDDVRVAREVLAQDCREAFDALVLMAAFALDAEQGSEMDWLTQQAPTDSPAGASTPTNTSATESAAEPLTDAAGDELAAPLSVGRGIGPDSAHDDAPDRSGASVTLTATDDRPPGEAFLPRRAVADGGTIAAQNPAAGVQRDWLLPPSVPGWAFGMAASLRSQQSPVLSPGGEVVCFCTDRHGWSIRVALAGTRSGEATVEGKRASFAWIGVPGFKAVADAAHELEIKVALAKKLDLGAIGQRLPREVSRVSAAIQDVRLAALQGFLALAQADVTPIDRLVAARAFQQRVAREQDLLARCKRSALGWPTSTQCSNRPVPSVTDSAGSSGSSSPLPNAIPSSKARQ